MANAIALIIAGTGETTSAEVGDLLEDAYSDYKDIGLIVPVDKDLYSTTVANAVAWYNDPEGVYPIQTKGAALSRSSAKLGGDDGPVIVANFVDVFADDFDGFDEVHFLIALPDDEEDEANDLYASLVETAIEAGIPVKDLKNGLDDVVLSDESGPTPEPEPEPTPEPEPEPEPKPKSRSRRAKPKPEPEPEPESIEEEVAEARRKKETITPDLGVDLDEKATGAVDGNVAQALSDLSSIAIFFEKVDESNALIQMSEVRYRPMTVAARKAFDVLAQATQGLLEGAKDKAVSLPTDTTEAPREAPAARSSKGRGRPRTNFEEKQIFDEDSDAWVVRPRGRVAKGTKTRTINTETDQVVEEGEV